MWLFKDVEETGSALVVELWKWWADALFDPLKNKLLAPESMLEFLVEVVPGPSGEGIWGSVWPREVFFPC